MIIYLLLFSLIIVFILILNGYDEHLHYTLGGRKYYDWSNFNIFLKYYAMYENSNRMHLNKNIIEFDNKLMLLDPISYLRYKKWYKNKHKIIRRQKGLWM